MQDPAFTDCNTDPRTTRRPNVIALDKHGVVQFSRVDSFVSPLLSAEQWEAQGGIGTIQTAITGIVRTSVAEYVAIDRNGDLLITTDQAFGIGMIKLNLTRTFAPTHAPTHSPTDAPTDTPTAPTAVPTDTPTNMPTDAPTQAPTAPTTAPSDAPTTSPSVSPTVSPTPSPTDPPGSFRTDLAMMDWYTGYEMCGLLSQTECSAHAVFGIATSDGGYAVTGKYRTSTLAGEQSDQGGWVLKQMGDPRLLGVSSKQIGEHAMLDINPYEYSDFTGTDYSQKARNTTWVAQWNSPTHHDGGNTVAEVGSDLFVGGFKYSSAANAILPVIMKFDPSLGKSALKWEVLLPIPTLSPTLAPTPGVTDPPEPTEAPTVRNGAVEVCQATADGGLVCVGVTNYVANPWLNGFKSYGNPLNGDMFVVKYSAAHLAGATAPTTPTWYKLFPNLISGKGIRELPASGGGGYVIGAHTNPTYLDATATYLRYAVLVKLDANGTTLWSKQYKPHGEWAHTAPACPG